MVRVDIRTVGSARRRFVELPAESEVGAVRRKLEQELDLPFERLKLVLEGKTLLDEKNGKPSIVKFMDGDSMIAMVAPKAPPKHISSRDGELEDEDEDLRFKLRDSATSTQRKLARFMREKLRVPDVVLIMFFSLSLRAWSLIFFWFLLAPIAHRWDLGPPFIIVTAFFIIFFNLGKRQVGEESAYSIFNEGFRELPGTLNAERLDRDIRAGQL